MEKNMSERLAEYCQLACRASMMLTTFGQYINVGVDMAMSRLSSIGMQDLPYSSGDKNWQEYCDILVLVK